MKRDEQLPHGMGDPKDISKWLQRGRAEIWGSMGQSRLSPPGICRSGLRNNSCLAGATGWAGHG